MASLGGFPSLCQELSRIQIRILQRQGAAAALGSDAVQLLLQNKEELYATTANAPYVPLFLKAVAALFQHAPPSVTLEGFELLQPTSRLAHQYVGNRYGDVNESSSVLRSLLALEKSHAVLAAMQPHLSGETATPSDEVVVSASNPFSPLVHPAYSISYEKWHQQRTKPTTLSVLSLVEGTAAVYGRSFHFTPVSHDMRGLLPSKSRVLMEAKLQRCFGARELLTSLRGMTFNRLDAGMSLNTLAEAGFYDEDVCNKSCEVLFSTHGLVTSQQLCEVLYSLGVLQHRHIHAKFFSSLVNFKKCDAPATLRQTLGLAMLQVGPPQVSSLLDGLFLHALRSRPADQRQQRRDRDHTRSSSETKADVNPYALENLWYIDAAHALSCLGIHHPKFKLMTARHARRGIHRLTTAQQCKLLYGLGGLTMEDVPTDLQGAWASKVEKTKEIVYKKLEHVNTEDGPQVANALHYCGVHSHPSIPKMPDLSSGAENPADVILRQWSGAPRERIMELTEQLQPHHLREDQPTKVSHVVTRVADVVGAATKQDSYRFGPLVAAVDASTENMQPWEVLRTINALERLDLVMHYGSSLESLLQRLWERREDMTAADCETCLQCLRRLEHLSRAKGLRTYCTSRSESSEKGLA